MSRYERAALRRQARREAEASRRAESRRNDPNARPCSSCGGWDHQRSSSKNCPNHIATRREVADFHRTSTIKTSLRNCCTDVNLQRVIKDTVMQARTVTYLGSLFVQLLIVSRLQNNLPVPPLTQSFFYNVFGQLVNLGREAPNWVKDLYQAFSQVGNFGSIMQGICIGSAIISNCALQYAANTVHHITSNFEKKSTHTFSADFQTSTMNGTKHRYLLNIARSLLNIVMVKLRGSTIIGQMNWNLECYGLLWILLPYQSIWVVHFQSLTPV